MSDERLKPSTHVDSQNLYWGHIHENGEIDVDSIAVNKRDTPLSKAHEAGGWRVCRIALVEIE